MVREGTGDFKIKLDNVKVNLEGKQGAGHRGLVNSTYFFNALIKPEAQCGFDNQNIDDDEDITSHDSSVSQSSSKDSQ